MTPFRSRSVPEQVADHLRREMAARRLEGELPGVLRLELDLGVNRKTVEAALQILEKERLLANQGAGKRRKILVPEAMPETRPLRVGILLFNNEDRDESSMMDLRHTLRGAGHVAFHPPRSLIDLGMKVDRVARMVGMMEADAWVVQSGSEELLGWFAARPVPAMALFGRWRQVPIAAVGIDKIPAIRELTRTLVTLGHRRTVLLAWPGNRVPVPSEPMQAFLDELSACGIEPGPYHLPDWKGSVDGFYECLESLFRVTPPSALIVDGNSCWMAAQQFLAARRLKQPQDISLACLDWVSDIDWCRPMVTHIRWDNRPLMTCIVRWVNHLAAGKPDPRQTFIRAELVLGGTIGPVNESAAF